MDPDAVYLRLTEGVPVAFEKHVVASILALSFGEAASGPVGETAGYEGLPDVLKAMFPGEETALAGPDRLVRSEDEACLHDLLRRGAGSGSPFELLLAGMIARRAQRPNHLWQDLGLRNRGELSALMTRYFAPLARRNRNDMKWKKFFFRSICRDVDYTLCTAPSCGECSDFDNCFNEETGEALLAHWRREAGG